MADRETLLKILDLARWAPSGDNTQPWRFEIVSDEHIAIHGHDTREWCLYDFDGHASHMAHGALLETLRIAATGHGLQAEWSHRAGATDAAPVFDIKLVDAPGLPADPLLPFIETRTVQRRPMRATPLTDAQRTALLAAPGPDYRVQAFESFEDRRRIARLLWDSAGIRLTCPEAYAVHKEIIEWGARFSTDRIPERAVGVDPLTGRLMRWVMQSWERVEFFNRYLFGTVPPRIQLDVIPALACSAHLLIRPKAPLEGVEAHVRLGAAMQRLWLTATSVGLHLQPQMTPVIFRWYARAGRSISQRAAVDERAVRLADEFERLVGGVPGDAFGFFGRVGVSRTPSARSTRKPLGELLWREG